MILYRIAASGFYALGLVLSLIGFASSVSKSKGPLSVGNLVVALVYLGMLVWTWLI